MDPASRRTVWGAMAAAKAGRTIVLTTHFLDEADALGDRIAVMHKGRLRAVGTSLSLKRRYGRAQHLTVARPPGGPPTTAQLLALVQRHVPEARKEKGLRDGALHDSSTACARHVHDTSRRRAWSRSSPKRSPSRCRPTHLN